MSGCFKREAAKILTKDVSKEVLHSTEKETIKDLAKNGSEKLGKSYVGRSFGEQIVKKAARDKAYKIMEKEGVTSFLSYGEKKAEKEISGVAVSMSKDKLLASTTNNLYKKKLLNLEKGTNLSVSKIGKMASRFLIRNKNQYITNKQYQKWILKHGNTLVEGKPKSGSILRENMKKVIGDKKYYKYVGNDVVDERGIVNQAHHIVGDGSTPSAMASKEILKKFDIDINSPMNGIFLPRNSRSLLDGTIHDGGHTKKYIDYVYNRLRAAKSKEQCYEILDDIKKELHNGKIILNSKY
jgi:hypothetical protein